MTVTELTRSLRSLVEVEFARVSVEGEVSNHRRQQSGHHYFTLKDEGAQLACVLFRGQAARLGRGLRLADGAQVVCHGELTVYEARGSVQLVVSRVEATGVGALQARFEALKARLAAEGLFDPAAKRPLPPFPRHIGLVTSPTGAALQDFLNIIGRRAPWLTVHLAAVPVQGEDAAARIAAALTELARRSGGDLPPLDAIILARGGGSLEDLWCFNDEALARSIHRCPLPVISAVGHEIDFTIADFVADLRAPTPSAAAELVAPDRAELLARLAQLRARLRAPLQRRLGHARELLQRRSPAQLARLARLRLRQHELRLDQCRQALAAHPRRRLHALDAGLRQLRLRLSTLQPQPQLQRRREAVAGLRQRLGDSRERAVTRRRDELRRLAGLLRVLSPAAVLQRGYSLTRLPDGRLLRDPADAPASTRLHTRLARGEVTSVSTGPG